MAGKELGLKERLRSHSSEKLSSTRLTTTLSTPVAIPENKGMSHSEGTTLESLGRLITTLTATVDGLKNEIADLKTSKSEKFSALETVCSETQQSLQVVLDQTASDSLKIKLLSAIVIQQDNHIKSLEDEILAQHKESRKANLVISGIDEPEGETSEQCSSSVTSFFKDTMEIEDDIKIKQVVCIGKGPHKSILATLTNDSDKAIIFANVSNLKGKENVRRKLFFISDDMLEAEREQQKYFRHLIKENKEKDEDDQLVIQLKWGKIFANNSVVQPKVNTPVAQDILTLQEADLEEVKQIKLHHIGNHEERDSEFFAYAQKIQNEKDVQVGLVKMKIKHGDANHIAVAYSLEDPKGPFKQGFADDKEHGAGWRMLEQLKQDGNTKIAVYVTRYHNHGKLGPCCFEIYKSLTKRATKFMTQWQLKFDRRSRLHRSNSQLSQLSMESLQSQDEELPNE